MASISVIDWLGGMEAGMERRHHLVYTCRWVTGAPIRYAEQEERVLEVHRLEMSIWNEEKRKRRSSNSWITDKEIRTEKVQALADWGRAWWKIEHEDTKVLKNRGYNLEHNVGHGEDHASENVCVMNLPAFLLHMVL